MADKFLGTPLIIPIWLHYLHLHTILLHSYYDIYPSIFSVYISVLHIVYSLSEPLVVAVHASMIEYYHSLRPMVA